MDEIDLWSAIKHAYLYNPTIHQQYHSYLADKERVTQTRSQLLPNITGRASISYRDERSRSSNVSDSEEEINQATTVEDDYETNNASITLTQTIFDAESWQNLKQSRSQVDESIIEFHTTKQDIALEVTLQYFNFLSAKDILDISIKEFKEIKKHAELTRKRFDNGIGTLTDVYESVARVKLAEVDITEAKNALKISRSSLKNLTGLDFIRAKDIPVDYDLPEIKGNPINEYFDIAMENSLELLLINQQLRTSAYEIKKQRSKHLPTIELQASSSRNDTSFSRVSTDNTLRRNEVMLQLSVPIFESFGTQAQLQEAYYRDLSLKDNYQVVIREKRNALEDALSNASASYKSSKLYKKAYVASNKALYLREKGYLEGLSSNLDLLDAYRDAYDSERNWLRSRNDYIVDYLRLKREADKIYDIDIIKINDALEVDEKNN